MTERPQKEFALAPAGPVDCAQAWMKITTPDNLRSGRRAFIMALLAWAPLLVMVILHPNPDADISFLHDIAVHARFLLILPLLVMAEGPIRERSRMVVASFRNSGLVANEDMGQFDALVRKGIRLVDSTVAELLVMLLSAALVYSAMRGVLSEHALFWFEKVTAQGHVLSVAGWWYSAVATPVFVFLMVRWLWRYLVWWWFLGSVARIDLRLTGTHPDRAGGLGFVSFHHSIFALITLAVGCAVSAAAANRILYAGASLKSFQAPIIGIAAGAVIVGIAPMLVFTPRLLAAKRKGWSTYGRFASNYVWKFEQKWFTDGGTQEEALGSGDIQSLADLGGSFERLVGMQVVLLDRRLILSFLIAAAAPMLPLLLTVMPFKEIIRALIKALI
jgi:hypothetical protein